MPMRSPSSRVLMNKVSFFPEIQSQDPAGAPIFLYSQTPMFANVPCSVQADGFEEIIDDQQRITRYTRYKIILGSYPHQIPRSKIVWVDNGGVTRTLFSQAARDEAGRGGAFTVRAVERI
jgi:hypothetical protein